MGKKANEKSRLGHCKMSNRKQMRVTLPASAFDSFTKAKKRAEDIAGITLTDTQFASRLLEKAIIASADK